MFDSPFPFQAIFQHLFNCAMNEIAEHVASEQCFGLEFEDRGANRFMSIRFWKKTELCRVLICRIELPSTELAGELGSLARLLSVVSTKVDVVTCSGCSVEFVRTIDEMPDFTRSVQSCFRFEHLDLQCLVHKTSYSVVRHIDFFSVLRGLVISLGGALTEDWMIGSPELTRVSWFYFHGRELFLGVDRGYFIHHVPNSRFSLLGSYQLQTGFAIFACIVQTTH